jgi:hypothetical protein
MLATQLKLVIWLVFYCGLDNVLVKKYISFLNVFYFYNKILIINKKKYMHAFN